MRDIEIPYESERHFHYRLFEILPGAITWSMIALPFVLSAISVTAAAIFILAYLLIYIIRAIAVALTAMRGYRQMKKYVRIDWPVLNQELDQGKIRSSEVRRPKWHYENLQQSLVQPLKIKPSQVLHAVIIATYKESEDVLEPTIKAVINSAYDTERIIFILAYEERGGESTEKLAHKLVGKYKDSFYDAMAIKHPKDIPGEIIGKGGNVTYAGRELKKYVEEHKIDPLNVIVTTLDADNRPHRYYFAVLTYAYCSCPDPVRASFQPVAMYTNNIWDAPAPMRVIAVGNSLFNIVLSLRPHILRNFSSHAQGLVSLIETDFWSVRTIVEDGHQFWRSYVRFDGDYRVYPLYLPIYQDAVLAETLKGTLRGQFIQLRRWTWGASDIAYLADKGFFHKNRIPKLDLVAKFLRLAEGHVTWAVGPLITLGAGFIPALFNAQSFAANELPLIASRVQNIALIGGAAALFVCLKTLPPRPLRYKRRRTLWMVLQWIWLPVTTVAYNALAALNSQTRLMFGWYLSKFDVTEKAVVTATGEKKS